MPLLEKEGDAVLTQLAQTTLITQTESLIKQHGAARVLDARRPKFKPGHAARTASQAQESHGVLGYATALASAGALTCWWPRTGLSHLLACCHMRPPRGAFLFGRPDGIL